MPEVNPAEKALTGFLMSIVFVRLAMAYVRGAQTRAAAASRATAETDPSVMFVLGPVAATPEPKKIR